MPENMDIDLTPSVQKKQSKLGAAYIGLKFRIRTALKMIEQERSPAMVQTYSVGVKEKYEEVEDLFCELAEEIVDNDVYYDQISEDHVEIIKQYHDLIALCKNRFDDGQEFPIRSMCKRFE